MSFNMYSVLMSVYHKDHCKWLDESLESIFGQTVRADEVVLVEDGPVGNDLEEVIERYSSIYRELIVVRLEKNGGLGKALNEGLKYCTNELVARMDSDDICFPNRFEKQLLIFQKYPQIDIVSSWIYEFIGTKENVISIRKLPEYPYEIFKYAKRRCPINHPAVMFRKSAIMLAGGYCHFSLFEDYHLWSRSILNGCKFYNIQEPLLWFRVSPDMYKRRGGIKHAINEVRFQNEMRKLGFINLWEEISNILVRFFVRIMSNSFRIWVYRNFLRK